MPRINSIISNALVTRDGPGSQDPGHIPTAAIGATACVLGLLILIIIGLNIKTLEQGASAKDAG